MTDPVDVPGVGSQVSHYWLVREVARGPLGALFGSFREGSEPPMAMLARIVPVPRELSEEASNVVSDAAWDSAIVSHPLSVRVADVLFGNGWLALLHDAVDGLLLPELEKRCLRSGLKLPVEVAIRIVLDVLEGLELSHEQSAEVKLKWRSGTVCPHSLCLCEDGRTRSLDGQVRSALLQIGDWNGQGPSASLALGAVGAGSFDDERTDVLLAGRLLLRLLTGREIEASDGNTGDGEPWRNALETAREVPSGVRDALLPALAREPAARTQTLRELAVALVTGAEKVATHAEVAEFVHRLPAADDEADAPTAALPSPATAAQSEVSSGSSQPGAEAALSVTHAGPDGSKSPRKAVRLSMISWADDGPPALMGVARPVPLVQPSFKERATADNGGASRPLVTRASLTSSRPHRADRRANAPDAVREVLAALDKRKAATASPPEPVEREPSRRASAVTLPTVLLGVLSTLLAAVVVLQLLAR